MVSAYIRLGHKYQMNTLVERSLRYLEDFYTTSFGIWNHRSVWDFTVLVPEEWHHDGDTSPAPFVIGVVNLARLARCDAILPTALFACCALDVEELLSGFEREDGTREQLSEDDLRLCIKGVRYLEQMTTRAIIKTFAPPTKRRGCKTTSGVSVECHKGMSALLRLYADSPSEFPTRLPLSNWDGFLGSKIDDNVCGPCHDELIERMRAEQRKIWVTLPGIFDLVVECWPKDEC